MRLIDADALIEEVDGDLTDSIAEHRAIEKILNAPIVDAAPVVRCKDCKYRDEQSANCTRFRKDWYVQSNSFCSWAERKEE